MMTLVYPELIFISNEFLICFNNEIKILNVPLNKKAPYKCYWGIN